MKHTTPLEIRTEIGDSLYDEWLEEGLNEFDRVYKYESDCEDCSRETYGFMNVLLKYWEKELVK